MNWIKVLIEGYAKKVEDGWLASSTAVLVKSSGKNIVVDPGCNREKLITSLEKENLTVSDIDYVILTHNHTDHTLLAGIFENAKVLNSSEIYDNDKQTAHNNAIPETDLKLLQTPGHVSDHCSVVVPASEGTYVIAGDVFWWMDNEEQIVDVDKKDPVHVSSMEKLVESRRKILDIADYVIPGHGKMFKVEK